MQSVSTKRAAVKVDPDAQVWLALLSYMRRQQPDICRQWFDQLEPLGVSGGVLRIRAHSELHRNYLQKACVGPFNDAAQTATGRLISVKFYGPEDDVEPASDGPRTQSVQPPSAVASSAAQPAPAATLTPTPARAEPMRTEPSINGPHTDGAAHAHQAHAPTSNGAHAPTVPASAALEYGASVPLSAAALEHLYDDGLVINPDYGFDNFVVGPNNRLAHAAALAVAANPGRAYNPFFVHGDVGLGKTHLLQAICLAIKTARPAAVIYYTSCEGFMTQFMDAVAAGAMNKFRHKFRHVDVLVVDDIHFLAKRDRTQEEFFHTFNSLYQSHKQIVLSSDAPPEEIPDLEDRLVSRFKWGLVAPISPPTYETRIEILKSKARMRGFELPEDVAAAVAARVDTNIRELEGAVTKLQMMSTLESAPISLELVKAALGEPEKKSEPTIQIQTIINAVTEFFGVKVTDLQSKRRQRSIALPRQLCMYLARRNTRYSLEEIGGYFGGRDHTTVMHAVRTIESRMGSDSEFGHQVAGLEMRLRGGLPV